MKTEKKSQTQNEERREQADKESILPNADPGTKHGHGEPMAGKLPKGERGKADFEAGAGNTDE